MAQTLNLRADQGSDFTINLTVADNLGVAYNLGEWTANSSFKKHHGSSTYYDLTTTVKSAPDGNLDLSLLPIPPIVSSLMVDIIMMLYLNLPRIQL